MITESLIRQLKQVNVSKDAEKTKQRTSEAWKTASKDAQEAILALSGLARSSVQRAYKLGSISAKIVVAFAHVLNLDPFYLTGEADDRGVCSEELLRSFLSSRGYAKLLPEQIEVKPKRRRRAKQKPAEQAEPVPAQDTPVVAETVADTAADAAQQEEPAECVCAAPETEVIDAETQAFIDNATEDEIILLVKSILLREKAGGKHAETAQKLKLFLLS